MGSTGVEFVCPICGRANVSGYALDSIGFPICSASEEYSCVIRVLQGVTLNGIRAGGLQAILRQSPSLAYLMSSHPSICFDIIEFLHVSEQFADQHPEGTRPGWFG